MKDVIEASELPTDERIYLKKGWEGEWRVVQPLKNEDGSWNWFNVIFGSKGNLVFLIILLLLAGAFYIGVNELIGNYKTIADNPCNFCTDCFEQTRDVLSRIRGLPINTVNFSGVIN